MKHVFEKFGLFCLHFFAELISCGVIILLLGFLGLRLEPGWTAIWLLIITRAFDSTYYQLDKEAKAKEVKASD